MTTSEENPIGLLQLAQGIPNDGDFPVHSASNDGTLQPQCPQGTRGTADGALRVLWEHHRDADHPVEFANLSPAFEDLEWL